MQPPTTVMTNRRSVLLGVLAAALPACTHAQPWQNVEPPDGRFSVVMPVRPRGATQKAITAWGPLDVRFYEADTKDGQVVYSVTYTDYPFERIDADKAAALLLDAQSAAVKEVAGVVLGESAVTYQGRPARRTGMRAASGVEYQLLVVLSGGRLYQVSTASRPGQLSNEDREKFFASFVIRGDASGPDTGGNDRASP
jgi:hypothetical protein